jgi:hypothetical protein
LGTGAPDLGMGGEEAAMIMAELFLARHETPFAAYMALQSALLQRHLRRGGSLDRWCSDIAPAYRRRYEQVFAAAREKQRAA